MKKIVIAIAAAGALLAGAQTREFSPSQKLRYAEGVISNFYVEKVNEDSLVDEGIKAMLATLDPHSQYSTPDETRELNQPLEGHFSGIGIMFNMVKDTVYVIQTTVGGPSEKAVCARRSYHQCQRHRDCRQADEKFADHQGAARPQGVAGGAQSEAWRCGRAYRIYPASR